MERVRRILVAHHFVVNHRNQTPFCISKRFYFVQILTNGALTNPYDRFYLYKSTEY